MSMAAINTDEKKEAVSKVPSAPSVEAQKFDNRQADQAALYLNSTEHYGPLTDAEHKRVMRKTDWILLPMVRNIESCSSINWGKLVCQATSGNDADIFR